MENSGPEKRKRSANYTSREKELLISLVAKHSHIIENKKTNAVYNKQKAEEWEKIADEYNASQTSGLRCSSQLKNAYEQMKKIAKQHKAEEKVEVVKTGGGIHTPRITNQDEKILAVIQDNYFSIDNPFDSNNHQIEKAGNGMENIIIYYDDDASTNNKDLECKITDIQSAEPQQMGIAEKTDTEANKGKKKRKRVQSPSNSENLIKSKIDVLQQKARILNVIEETEKENLKGKKLDNEIKEIIKEQELLKLKILKQECG